MRRSIRRRLVVLTAASCAGLVGATCALAWWRMARVLRDDFDRTLHTEALALSRLVEDDGGRIQFELDAAAQAQAELAGGPLVFIRTADGDVIYATRQMGLDGAFGRAFDAGRAESPSWFDLSLSDGRPARGLALRTLPAPDPDHPRPADAPPPAVWICVARPLAPLRQTLNELAWTLGGAALAALLAAVVIAYRVAGDGVRPLRRVAQVIAETEPGAARLALAPTDTPLELDPIIEKTNELLGRIRAELARQRQLTADVAHDLRTPVAGVRALLEVCLSRPRSAAEYEESLAAALAALRELSRLLDDVLTMARLDAGAEQPRRGRVALAEAVAGGLRAVQPLAQTRGVRLDTSGIAEAAVLGDAVSLEKIIVNLLSNAVGHSPAGAAVSVSTATRDGSVELHVRDRGCGIAPELRERIFDRFVRGDAARAGDGHHGLGLPIARGLARALGGELRLKSSSPAGSHFVLTLPRAAEA